jgi:uncharacterized sulfatase
MGNPYHLNDSEAPSFAALEFNTYATFSDMDQSPTKAWLVEHRKEPEGRRLFDIAFARRPREELYLLASDPHQMRNVAEDPTNKELVSQLKEQLFGELKRTGDPRALGDDRFEKPPFAGAPPKKR